MPPRFSIIIPVINEEAVINSTIEHLETLKVSESMEIIVVDGDRSGKTIGAVRNGNVKTAVGEKGRGNQMNNGAAMARGDIVVFLHADTRLPPNALALMEGALSDPNCLAGAFDLAIDSGRPIYRLIAKIASFRSRFTRIPYGDQAFFFRRNYFQDIGGFANIPLMEDVEIMWRIKKRGERIAIINRSVTTSARRWEKEGILLCTLRNWLLISLYFSGVSPERLSRFYK
ncbi:MAG: TIGR04283 family arsenosugar biosynthesis glycosyltransferase [Deltaproteobacteria bacterium]|nr:TIGR04283 family arsenosugar biosynthesis glycosyltransferase [Deltaproteobacteria bacterium]